MLYICNWRNQKISGKLFQKPVISFKAYHTMQYGRQHNLHFEGTWYVHTCIIIIHVKVESNDIEMYVVCTCVYFNSIQLSFITYFFYEFPD